MKYHKQWLTAGLMKQYTGTRSPEEIAYTGSGMGFFLCLADSATLTESSNASEFFAAELAIGVKGYSRHSVTPIGPALFDNATLSASLPTIAKTWTPIGGALQLQTVFLIAYGAATGNSGAIVFCDRLSQINFRREGQPFTYEFTLGGRTG
jgi:hypothetical protein